MREAEVYTLTGAQGTPYLTRVTCGPFRIHIFWRGDNDPDCHDHPSDFWTFPLVSYREEFVRQDGSLARRTVKAFRLHYRKAEFAHRVLHAATIQGAVGPRPIVTLLWWRQKRREWGFRTANGWVDWKTYFGVDRAAG